MNVNIRDPAAFSGLNHRDVRAYLLGQGWKEVDRLGDKGTVLVFADSRGETWEALVPLRQTIGDYVARLADVVALLAKIEQRSELAVLFDLTVAGTDVIRVRAPQAEREGTITVGRGVALYEQSRELLLSAACAARDPRPSYHTGKVTEAVSYIDTVRFGQTERGSYVLTLLSPVDPSLNINQPALAPEFEDDPFSRKVTRTLATALKHLSQAVTTSSVDAFHQAVPQGVSANLCEAVAALVESGGGIDLGITWARTRPGPGPSSRTCFASDDAGVLREAARVFRQREPKLGVVLTGWVTKLAREPQEFDGKATLKVLMADERRPRNVQSTFDPADYNNVVEAFRHKRPITLEGDLIQAGRTELRNPRVVAVDAGEEDDADVGSTTD